MFLKSLFDILSYYHHLRIADYIKKLNFTNLIDVGGHEGEFLSSVIKIKKIKYFFCFEPQIKQYKILEKKFKKNNKVKLNNFALGDSVCYKKLYLSKFSSTSSIGTINKNSLYLKFKNFLTRDHLRPFIYVKVDTIDNFFKSYDIKKIFLKVDVEGYDLNVLKGCQKKFKEVNYILVEHQFGNHYKNNSFKKIKKYLAQKNFNIIKNFYFPTLHYKDVLFAKVG